MQLGIDRLLREDRLRAPLRGRRVALLGHPASVTAELRHSLDALCAIGDVRLSCAFGPQHGMKGDKQDNMIETPDEIDPVHGIPVYSLYGRVRRPTDQMLDAFDVLLVDLQDVGTRVYTFITTLLYMMQGCARAGRAVWVLDRPNPAGRPVEGTLLRPGADSFVGAGPMPMRHGLTIGEMARWFQHHFRLDLDLQVIAMQGYDPESGPGFGWPLGELSWVNPSPNAASLSMARCYAGTVLLEGTTLSEGRGTTRPLEGVGAPDLDVAALLRQMHQLAPEWLEGCRLRPCFFCPTFHKHAGSLCRGLQIHVDDAGYKHDRFRPYRLIALLLKALRRLRPDYPLWRDFPYEYVTDRLPIDTISGGSDLRRWVDDAAADPSDLEALLQPDEAAWREERRAFVLY
ncbi:MAG: DUF1343 domain-containing protein [Myxococcales bacterium]|nr:DUF1343 domain-containing protein [Myxococcota bacterium]MDW8281587.1 DUF1343 domain-containing protein [Myxococcales bacterium]